MIWVKWGFNMKYLKEYNEYVSKHKGEIVKPNKVYHKSNPKFRDLIDNEGLKTMKGDSYSAHSPEEGEQPAIFGYMGDDIKYYDSTYDDDVWLIDARKINNIWFYDKEVGSIDKLAVVTYTDIPRNAIELVYRGTGESDF